MHCCSPFQVVHARAVLLLLLLLLLLMVPLLMPMADLRALVRQNVPAILRCATAQAGQAL